MIFHCASLAVPMLMKWRYSILQSLHSIQEPLNGPKFYVEFVTLLPNHRAPPANPTDPRPSPSPKSQTLADFRSFLDIFDRFRPILVKNCQNRLEIGSSKRGLLNVSAVWGQGSMAGSQVTMLDNRKRRRQILLGLTNPRHFC